MWIDIFWLLVRFGVLGFGLYPLGLELAVEAIFPLDESAGTIFIFLFGQISALVVISLKGPLAQNLTEEDGNIQVGFKEHHIVQGHRTGCRTGNGGKLSNSWFYSLTPWLCLGAASLISISCANTVRRRRIFRSMILMSFHRPAPVLVKSLGAKITQESSSCWLGWLEPSQSLLLASQRTKNEERGLMQAPH